MVGQLDIELEDAVGALDGTEERLRVDLEGGDDGREIVDRPWQSVSLLRSDRSGPCFVSTERMHLTRFFVRR